MTLPRAESLATRIVAGAGHDANRATSPASCVENLDAFALHIDPVAAKQRQFASYAAQHSRMPDGRARKR